MSRTAASLVLAAASICAAAPAAAATIASPEEFLGRKVGEDRYLAPYPKVIEYLRALDAASDRVTVETAGASTLGNEMVVAVITSEENQEKLDSYREIARRLANPDDLTEAEARRLIDAGKAIVLVTCSIHSTEVGSTQMTMELAWQLATSRDPAVASWLDDVILLVMPSINPDGQVMVVDWYERYLGTEHEGGRMPWLYHHYVGHDDNRDYYMLTQKESRVVNDVLYRRWFPQVFLDEHQMGSTGPRMFVPPQTDPLAEEIDSMIFRLADILGTAMSLRLEEAGKTGVGHDMIFDSYWPGGTRNTAWWKNVTGLLSEVASARIATPVYVEPEELRGGVKGLPDYQRRANYPSPWKGGWWRLRDIIDYELIATKSLLETSARYRKEILTNFYHLGRQGIERGASEPPYAFVVPPGQHDPSAAAEMIDLLLRHGVRVERTAGEIRDGNVVFPAGSYVIPASQPYRPFLLTMLRPQRYPEVTAYPGGPIFEPYDVTSWSLPILMGVEILEAGSPPPSGLPRIEEPLWPGGEVPSAAGGYAMSHADDAVFKAMNRLLASNKRVFWLEEAGAWGPAGTIYVPASEATAAEMTKLSREARIEIAPLGAAPDVPALRVRPVRVGLYKPWVASMDEGWTRWLLERNEFTYVSLANKDFAGGAFARKIDVLLLPDVEKAIIKDGKPPEDRREGFVPLPPEYSGGIGEEGAAKIRKWILEDGGSIVALGSSTEYVIDLLELPATNVLAKVKPADFSCPGSMLRLDVDTSLPAAYGMRASDAGYFAGAPAFATRPPDGRFERRVIASYPDHGGDILLSGYLKGADLIKKRAAAVDFEAGKGRAVLIGFQAQHRAQPHRSFKLLFNALHLGALEPVPAPR